MSPPKIVKPDNDPESTYKIHLPKVNVETPQENGRVERKVLTHFECS